jgi:hypothetical protein
MTADDPLDEILACLDGPEKPWKALHISVYGPFIGMGNHATLFEHPSRPDLVVRVSKPDDGWVSYAEQFMDSGERSPYAPAMLDLVASSRWDGQQEAIEWISIAERLQPVSSLADKAVVEAARKVMDPLRLGDPTEEDLALLDARQPGLRAFIEQGRAAGWDDSQAPNFMMRGAVMVVNDPVYRMPSAERKADLESGYALAERLQRTAPPTP